MIPTTYLECLNLIASSSTTEDKLYYISLLPSLRVGNPLYREGLAVLAGETNLTVKEALSAEIFQFLVTLTPEERDVFNYVADDYIENNPGIVGNAFASYVGIYINQQGEYS